MQPKSVCLALKSPVMIEYLCWSACLMMSLLSSVLCLELCGGTKYEVIWRSCGKMCLSVILIVIAL